LSLIDQIINVVFSEPLTPGNVTAANWTYVYGGNAFSTISSLVYGSNQVEVEIGADYTDPRAEGLYYAAEPPDVLDADGVPISAFSAFPVERN